MIGERIKTLRKKRGYTLNELAKVVGKSISTISRIENKLTPRIDSELLIKIADALGVSVAFLMQPEEITYQICEDINNLEPGQIIDVVVEDDDMEPALPKGSVVRIRAMMPNEKLQEGSFYFLEFNQKKKFRYATYDEEDGLGFLPLTMSEMRIKFDRDYVKIIGKLITMKVIFEDSIEYEVD